MCVEAIDMRQLGTADAALIAAIHATALADASGEPPWDQTAMDRILQMPRTFGFLASTSSPGAVTPAGFVLARLAANEAEILTLAVVPAHRRCGVAGHLVRRVIDWARGSGAHGLYLEVATDNLAAQGLYRQAGFTQIGRRRNYYRRSWPQAVDALSFKKSL
jgi:ribosomal-protein-alanine N-acetyltransferase